jgi:hypothetical protein
MQKLTKKESNTWVSTNSVDIQVGILQLVLKTVLASVGWHTLLTLPPIFSNNGDVLALDYPNSTFAMSLFAFVTLIDLVWHWGGDWSNICHHVFALSGCLCSWLAGASAPTILSMSVIMETVAPCYQLLKFRKRFNCVASNITALRWMAVAVNICVRVPFNIWLASLLCRQCAAHWNGHDPDQQVTPAVWAIFVIICCAGLFLDYIWTSQLLTTLLRRVPRECKSPVYSPRSPG